MYEIDGICYAGKCEEGIKVVYRDHHKESLEAKCQERFEIVCSDGSPFPVCHGCKRDRCNGNGQIYFNHPSVENYGDQDGHDFECQTDNGCFQC